MDIPGKMYRNAEKTALHIQWLKCSLVRVAEREGKKRDDYIFGRSRTGGTCAILRILWDHSKDFFQGLECLMNMVSN